MQVAYVGPMLGQAHQYLFYHRGKSKFAEEKTKGYVEHVYSILEKQLVDKEYIVDDYSIADIAIWPWVDRCERQEINLEDYPNIYFVGDALSARGITVSGAQGTYVAESILKSESKNKNQQLENSLYL